MNPRPRPAPAICPLTGVTIPECSCIRCIEEQIRHHSPSLLERRFASSAQRLARKDQRRAA